jgi:hypothetical protein
MYEIFKSIEIYNLILTNKTNIMNFKQRGISSYRDSNISDNIRISDMAKYFDEKHICQNKILFATSIYQNINIE